MSQNEMVELLERTVAELEAQQLTTQQLLGEALGELEVLYAELEEQAQLLADFEPEAGAGGGAAEHPDQDRLEQELANALRDREHLESQMIRLQREVEQLVASASGVENGDAAPLETDLSHLAVPGATLVRAPFDQLRQQRGEA
ncbi:MAG: hypothetical protein KDB14_00730 [Planctomycetales bacterium]|nr:hypothetical protein [Planctomycetales bacterium]